jgi:hypothetical protein
MRLLFSGVLATLLGLGCARVCPRQQPVTGLDGGVAPCVVATDCPRPSSVLVCGQDEDALRGCIACESGACTQYVAEACP